MNMPPLHHNVPTRLSAMHDVSDAVKLWGRRGLLGGAMAGVALGVVFVSFPAASTVLAFGTIGTLLVAAVEGAGVAGALSACAAAICGSGVIRGRGIRFDRIPPSGRRARDHTWHEGDAPLPEFPAKWTYPPRRPPPLQLPTPPHSGQEKRRDTGSQQQNRTGPQFGNFKRAGTARNHAHPGR